MIFMKDVFPLISLCVVILVLVVVIHLEDAVQSYMLWEVTVWGMESPTCAPVSVAMSRIISADRSLLAYTTPSARTSLPSASVLLISTVLQNKRNRTNDYIMLQLKTNNLDLTSKITLQALHILWRWRQIKWFVVHHKALLSRVESVNIIRTCGYGPHSILCQAKDCMEVILKTLMQTEDRVYKSKQR